MMEKFLQTSSSERINTSQWYSPETGIYHSKHPSVNLPANDSLLDVASFIFSHKHNGRTALVDSLSGYSISYPQLFPLVQSVASGLRHHFGISQVVPPILMALTKAAKGLCGNSLKSLKQVSSGAAPANSKIIEDFVGAFPHVDFIQGYGMTESTAVGTRGFNTKKFSKYFSVGLLAPNMQAKVVDWVNGCFLPPGSTGELWLRGPGTMKEYINNADATMSTIDKEGWLHTGDIAYFDEDGYLYIVDRLKEVIKYNGYQISPADLETVLICHPEILDVAVTGAMDKVLGEIPVAFVVRRDGSTLTEAAVIDYLAQRVAPYKKVRRVVFTKSIPKSAAGKVLRRELRKFLTSKL